MRSSVPHTLSPNAARSTVQRPASSFMLWSELSPSRSHHDLHDLHPTDPDQIPDQPPLLARQPGVYTQACLVLYCASPICDSVYRMLVRDVFASCLLTKAGPTKWCTLVTSAKPSSSLSWMCVLFLLVVFPFPPQLFYPLLDLVSFVSCSFCLICFLSSFPYSHTHLFFSISAAFLFFLSLSLLPCAFSPLLASGFSASYLTLYLPIFLSISPTLRGMSKPPQLAQHQTSPQFAPLSAGCRTPVRDFSTVQSTNSTSQLSTNSPTSQSETASSNCRPRPLASLPILQFVSTTLCLALTLTSFRAAPRARRATLAPRGLLGTDRWVSIHLATKKRGGGRVGREEEKRRERKRRCVRSVKRGVEQEEEERERAEERGWQRGCAVYVQRREAETRECVARCVHNPPRWRALPEKRVEGEQGVWRRAREGEERRARIGGLGRGVCAVIGGKLAEREKREKTTEREEREEQREKRRCVCSYMCVPTRWLPRVGVSMSVYVFV